MRKRRLCKIVDDTDSIRTKAGETGVLKEEVWVDEKNEIVKYSLAYVCHAICTEDNGRVLGYDNAHDVHERHRMGRAEVVPFTSYTALVQSFLEEVQEWRERT